MKVIKFCEEVIAFSQDVTFWVMNQGNEYRAQYCVNMSALEKQDMMGEPTRSSIIRSEGYETSKEAHARLNGILKELRGEE
jgi:hypothetical protein